MFNAKIIADSKNAHGNRITTMIVTFPRIILAEFNTHRMFSRNSASSRAIPFERMLKSVDENPFVPIRWMRDHRGMQGDSYFTDKDMIGQFRAIDICESKWLQAREYATTQAVMLNRIGVTKQFINRLLEPFMWHTVIVTATEWENFFALRVNANAEIHMQHIAQMMLDEYNKSEPRLLKSDEWHIPMIEIDEQNTIDDATLIKIATARCARVSYTIVNDEQKQKSHDDDIALHDKLLSSGHMSPFEHCAQPINEIERKNEWCGNFCGFTQYRKTIENENRNDERVIKK